MNLTPLELAAIIIAFQFLVLLYVIAKDKSVQKNMRTIAKSVGEIDRHMYEYEMRVNEKIKSIQVPAKGISETEVEMLTDGTVSSRLVPVEQALQVLQEELIELKRDTQKQINHVESSLKAASMTVNSMGTTDEKKILQLYAEGTTIENIAKSLRISNAEVEFALKVANFN